jgi:hypothetical protein
MPETTNPSNSELEAIRLRWRHLHREAARDAEPTEEETLVLLQEIRDREEAIEQETHKMLMQAVRNAPSRSGVNSRYMRFFLLVVLVPLLAIGAAVGLINWLGAYFR